MKTSDSSMISLLLLVHTRHSVIGNDLLANELFNDVFESDDTNGTASFSRVFRNQDHVGLALLEEIENVQAACLRARLWEGSEGEVADAQCILGVVSDEHLDKQHAYKVVFVLRSMDWDARVSCGKNAIHHLFIEDSIR